MGGNQRKQWKVQDLVSKSGVELDWGWEWSEALGSVGRNGTNSRWCLGLALDVGLALALDMNKGLDLVLSLPSRK